MTIKKVQAAMHRAKKLTAALQCAAAKRIRRYGGACGYIH